MIVSLSSLLFEWAALNGISKRAEQVEVAPGMAYVFAVKDDEELSAMRVSADLTCRAQRKFMVNHIENVKEKKKRMENCN